MLICGGTGFIGRNLVESLAKSGRFDVSATHFKRESFPVENVKWIRANLCDPAEAERAVQGIQIVVQAAATTSGSKDIVQRPYIHVTDNAVMNSLLLRACHGAGVEQFIFFSCTIMYPSSEIPLKETDLDMNTELQKNYFGAGWTKLYIEKMCEFYSRLGVTRHTVLRHSNIYGPHDKYDPDRSHVFGASVAKVARSNGTVDVWGSGEEKRDWLHVHDLVRCVEDCIDRQPERFALFNVGLGKAHSVNELIRKMIELSGKNSVIRHDIKGPSIPTSIAIDCARIQKTIGWQPRITLEEGIASTLDWYAAHTVGK